MKNFRSGFSMIELILVMTVLGIVASISSTIIVKVYEGYILQRGVYKANISTELVTTQIANRLTYAITDSIILRKTTSDPALHSIDDIRSIQSLKFSDETLKQSFGILEWIGYDNDSFSATKKPGWSGFNDINRSEEIGTSKIIKVPTPASNLNSATDIIGYLGKIGNKNSTLLADGAVIFSGKEYSNYKSYDPSCMGFVNSQCISRVASIQTSKTPQEIHIEKNTDANQKKIVTDQYRLVWSAYAIVPGILNRKTKIFTPNAIDPRTGTYDLVLYSNYQPWKNETYNNGDFNLLAENITQFKIKGNGSIIRFKICIK
ncbi:MAG: prepilin-type N-terminal cleavage/methylation domain-containing protein, partial [Sulfurovum sp.]|nr:prepilin-type N-terminal cleavage/methylation domain-containing protein [Sulfurovaceae bacterium]